MAYEKRLSAGLLPSDHPWCLVSVEIDEDLECRGVERNILRAGLRIRETEAPTLEIDVLPPKGQDLVQPTAREDKETDRRDRGIGHAARTAKPVQASTEAG